MKRRRILYVQYTNPAAYPPLLHSSRMLADEEWDVLMLGTRGRSTSVMVPDPHPRIKTRLLPYAPPGPRQKLHYLRYASRVMAAALSFRPDWCYASDIWSCPIALMLQRTGQRVIYHEHDRPGPDQNSAFARLCLRARAQLATKATLCVFPNEERAADFAREHPGARTAVVWNCASAREVTPRSTPADGPFTFYYHGTLVPERLPVSVIEALSDLPDARLRIGGYETIGAISYSDELQRAARRLGLSERVEVIGIAPTREDLLRQMDNAHVGITLVPSDPVDMNLRQMAGASNKPFDYLARGLGLLITDREDWTHIFGEYGSACTPEKPQSIAAAMKVLASDRERTARIAHDGQQRVEREWNYERQFAQVKQLLDA